MLFAWSSTNPIDILLDVLPGCVYLLASLDLDPDGDPLATVLMSGPSSGSLTMNPDGSFDYLPETNYSGVVTFNYVAYDGQLLSNRATVTITVGKSVSEIYLPLTIR